MVPAMKITLLLPALGLCACAMNGPEVPGPKSEDPPKAPAKKQAPAIEQAPAAKAAAPKLKAAPLAVPKSAADYPCNKDPDGVFAGGDTPVCDTLFIGKNKAEPERRQLLDRCGRPFVIRGVEQVLSRSTRHSDLWADMMNELGRIGVNAFRLLPYTGDPATHRLTSADLDRILTLARQHHLVVWLSPTTGTSEEGGTNQEWHFKWFQDNFDVLLRHQDHIVIDAFHEPDFDDCKGRWTKLSQDSIRRLRAMRAGGKGFTGPLSVMGNQYGRDLTCDLKQGGAVVGVDPLKRSMVGWQAYWDKGGWYQRHHKMTLQQGVQAVIDNKAFPIQLGIVERTDYVTKLPMDYGKVMTLAEGVGTTGKVGYLWWHWWSAWTKEGGRNDLMIDSGRGRIVGIRPRGRTVLYDHKYAISKVAKKACFPD